MLLSGLLTPPFPTLSWSGLRSYIGPREAAMSMTVFLAISVLSCDFLLYVLFQWVYGDKRRKRARRSPTPPEQRSTGFDVKAEATNVFPFPQRPIHHRTGFF
jgi:hypothetical protein